MFKYISSPTTIIIFVLTHNQVILDTLHGDLWTPYWLDTDKIGPEANENLSWCLSAHLPPILSKSFVLVFVLTSVPKIYNSIRKMPFLSSPESVEKLLFVLEIARKR